MTKPPIPLRPAPSLRATDSVYRAAFATFATFAAACRPGVSPAEERAIRYPSDEVAGRLIERTAVDVADSTTSGWAAELATSATAEFLRDLAPGSAAAGLIAMNRNPVTIPAGLGEELRLLYPHRPGAPVARPTVAEGAPIPAGSDAFDLVTISAAKLAVILVATRELATRSYGEAIFRDTLAADAAASLDSAYFSTATGGLLNSVTPLATTGDYREDLQTLGVAAAAGGSGRVVYITGPGRYAATMLRNDLNITMMASSVVSDTTVIACDPAGIVHAFGEPPDIQTAEHATVTMDDAPGAFGTGSTRSAFQTNSIAVRLLLDYGFAKRRAGAVAYMDGLYAW